MLEGQLTHQTAFVEVRLKNRAKIWEAARHLCGQQTQRKQKQADITTAQKPLE